jgi:hypothetical protein
MKLSLQAASPSDIEKLRDAFPLDDLVSVHETAATPFYLTGDPVTGFIFVTLNGVLTRALYDLAKSYFQSCAARLKSRLPHVKPPLKVTVNGVIFTVKTEQDVDSVLDAMIAGLDQDRKE